MGADDDPPVIEVLGAPSEVRSETVVASGGRWSWRHGVGLAVGAAVVALTIGLGGDGGDRPEDDTAGAAETTTSTTTSVTTTTVPPAGTYLTGSDSPVFSGEVDASVLLGGEEEGWRHVDLASGYVEPVPVLDGVAPDELLPVRGGVLVLEAENFGRLQFVPLATGAAVDAKRLDFWPDISDARVVAVMGVLSSGSPDRFWVLSQPMEPGRGREAVLVAVRGERLMGPFELPVEPIAGTRDGLVYNAGGRVHLIRADGSRALAPGVAYAASTAAVGLVACDETAQCRQGVVDAETGEQRTGGTVDAFAVSHAGIMMDMSANGDLAVLTESPPGIGDDRTQLPSTTLHVTGPAGSTVTTGVASTLAGPVWLPDGRGVLMCTAYGLHEYRVVDGQLVVERARGLRTRGDTGMFVIED